VTVAGAALVSSALERTTRGHVHCAATVSSLQGDAGDVRMATTAVKSSLRRTARERVLALPRSVRDGHDRAICEHLRSLREYAGVRQLLVYRALRDEVSLDALIAAALGDGKRLYLPRVEKNGSLGYAAWSPGQPLARSGLGIEEPTGGTEPGRESSLCVVPGRAFDSRGARLGRGMGCFDRALEMLCALGPTVGVGYSCQLIDAVPESDHDRRVDLVVTECGVVSREAH
jgi:5-formyltetrahydrofolate cyclo-ligase